MHVRVVIADDQPLMRTGLRKVLESEPGIEVAGEAADGREALDVVRHRRPDVALMDIRMPILDGLEATRRIVALGIGTRVLILTTYDLDESCSPRCAPERAASCSRTAHRRNCSP